MRGDLSTGGAACRPGGSRRWAPPDGVSLVSTALGGGHFTCRGQRYREPLSRLGTKVAVGGLVGPAPGHPLHTPPRGPPTLNSVTVVL